MVSPARVRSGLPADWADLHAWLCSCSCLITRSFIQTLPTSRVLGRFVTCIPGLCSDLPRRLVHLLVSRLSALLCVPVLSCRWSYRRPQLRVPMSRYPHPCGQLPSECFTRMCRAGPGLAAQDGHASCPQVTAQFGGSQLAVARWQLCDDSSCIVQERSKFKIKKQVAC